MDGERKGLKHEDLTRTIIGVFYEVHNELGYGFVESVYQKAMAIALKEKGLSFQEQPPLSVKFRGVVVGEFRPDFIVEGKVVLELKVAASIHPDHHAQLLNGLHATDLEVGLILAFGPRAQFQRLLYDNDLKGPTRRRDGE